MILCSVIFQWSASFTTFSHLVPYSVLPEEVEYWQKISPKTLLFIWQIIYIAKSLVPCCRLIVFPLISVDLSTSYQGEESISKLIGKCVVKPQKCSKVSRVGHVSGTALSGFSFYWGNSVDFVSLKWQCLWKPECEIFVSFTALSSKCPYRPPHYQYLVVLNCLSGGQVLQSHQEEYHGEQGGGRLGVLCQELEQSLFMWMRCTQVKKIHPSVLPGKAFFRGRMLSHICRDFSCLCFHACHEALEDSFSSLEIVLELAQDRDSFVFMSLLSAEQSFGNIFIGLLIALCARCNSYSNLC